MNTIIPRTREIPLNLIKCHFNLTRMKKRKNYKTRADGARRKNRRNFADSRKKHNSGREQSSPKMIRSFTREDEPQITRVLRCSPRFKYSQLGKFIVNTILSQFLVYLQRLIAKTYDPLSTQP